MSHLGLEDSDNSIIHQDSDDDEIEHDDDVDIGFRRHQFPTFGNGRHKRRQKEENLYGVFYQEPQQAKRSKTDSVPMFVAASKRDDSDKMNRNMNKSNNDFGSAIRKTKKSNHAHDAIGGTEESMTPEGERTAEAKIREEQKAADDYFMSLLNRGRTKQSSRLTQDVKGLGKRTNDYRTPLETAGLDPELGLGLLSSLGRMEETATSTTEKLHSSLGKWEKHTKGIGSKLLAKMGWSGNGGLGSNRRKLKRAEDDNEGKTETAELRIARKGISRPVEVVVRPASLGLGFGNFKEASQLKTNRQIEAEVRGLEVPGANDNRKEDEIKVTAWSSVTSSSSIPGADRVLAQKQWRRKRKATPRKVTIVPYEDLLRKETTEEEEVRIIDMTGQRAGEKEKATNEVETQLGAEILHNISFLLNTHESKLHSSAYFLRSIGRKCDSFQSDVEEMKRRQEEGHKRIDKLKQMFHIVSQVEALTQKFASANSSPQLMKDALSLLEEVSRNFSVEEKQSLHFWKTVAPAILGPIIQLEIDRWNPLQPIDESKGIIDLIFGLVQTDGTNVDNERIPLRDSVIHNQLLPKVKGAFDSIRWIASQHTDFALDLYVYIMKKAVESPPSGRIEAGDSGTTSVLPLSDEAKTENLLAANIKRILIFESTYSNLQRSISRWKPILKRNDDGLEIQDRLDIWILPWLPHLDHPAVLPNVIADCRRKTKYVIEVLLQKSKSDIEFLSACISILRPWRNIFDATELQSMVSDIITPRLARHLAKQRLDGDITGYCTRIFSFALDMHQAGLLSDNDFLSVIEGEVLIRWASSMRKSVLSSCKSSQSAQRYMSWKRLLLTKCEQKSASRLSKNSLALLLKDESICRIFWSVLRILQLAHNSEKENLNMISFPTTNFQIVAARRAREKNRAADEELNLERRSLSAVKQEPRVRPERYNVDSPTFREVVEEFAKNEGITFKPRLGSNTMKDGRQIFQFGNASIYIEGNVIFEFKGNEWLPVALDKLAASSSY